jgi:hypothetical protein
MNPWGGATLAVLGASQGMDLPPFYVMPPPSLHPDERGITAEALQRVERSPQTGPLARVYAWGPKNGDWEHASRWLVRWVSPYGGWSDARGSLPSSVPQLLLDASRVATPSSVPIMATWQLGVSDDGAHALIAARRSGPHGMEVTLFELEEGHAPLEVRRADGEPFTDIESATRMGGRWYLSSAPLTTWANTLFQIDGGIARELARVPRAGMDARPSGSRLARRADGRSVGLVVDGQPSPDRAGAQRWVVPIDVDSGSVGEPEPLGASDLGDRPTLALCTEDDGGWVLDAPYNLGVRLYVAGKSAGSLSSIDARLRVSSGSACIEKLAGTMGSFGAEQAGAFVRTGGRASAMPGTSIGVVAISASSRSSQMRYPLRCSRR